MITRANEGSRVGSTASNFAFQTRAQHVRFQHRVSLVVCRGPHVCPLLSSSSGNVVCRQTDRQTEEGRARTRRTSERRVGVDQVGGRSLLCSCSFSIKAE